MIIKICGLRREADIEAANEVRPDLIGFVFARKSPRYVSPEQAARLKALLAPGIRAVGVFTDEKPENIATLLETGVIDFAQLHGFGFSGSAEGTPAVGIVISDVSEENAQYYGLESAGVYIAQVTGVNAQQAGFQAEDRIVSFNGTQISDSNEFITLVRKCKVGDTVSIVVSRNGQQIEIKTVLEELQQQ